jgi:hypothetical protein
MAVSKALSFLNFIVFVWSVLTAFNKWNGNTVADVSYKYPTYITPAPFTFSIWGTIYFLLLVFAVCQLFQYFRSTREVQAIGPWFLIACALQGAWVIAWCYENITYSALIMFGIFLALAKLNVSLHMAARPVQFPFTLWFGWITGATFISLVIAMYYDFGLPLNNVYSSVVIVTVTGLLGCFWMLTSKEIGFSVSSTWFTFGIYMTNYDHTINIVALVVTISQLAFILLTIIRLWLEKRRTKKKEINAEEVECQQLLEPDYYPALYFPQYSYSEHPYSHQQIPIYQFTNYPMEYERPRPSAPQPV